MARVSRRAIVATLREMAQLLEIKGESAFRVRAYDHAARLLEGLAEEPAELAASGRLSELPGIGPALAAGIAELIASGRFALHEELKRAVPPGALDLLRLPGLGAKKVRTLVERLGVDSIPALEAALADGRLAALAGFGAKSAAKLGQGIVDLRRYAGQHLLSAASGRAEELLERLRRASSARVELAGSLRRCCETIGDLDLLASVAEFDRPKFAAAVAELPEIERLLASDTTKISLLLEGGLPVDVRMVEASEFGAAWLAFTGSESHHAELRGRARDFGWTLNEVGLFRGEERLVGESEAEIYRALGLAWIAPELREGLGEIDRAARGDLPRLIEPSDLRGTLHVHTTWSDGTADLAAMAEAAKTRGWSYLGIADHSVSAAYAGGLTPERVRAQWRAIDDWNAAHSELQLFRGTECDILADGSLDFPDDLLLGFDFVVASVHSRFQLSREEMTRRLVRAASHPAVTFLGHPTGRLLLEREGYDVDLEAVLTAAAAHGAIVELNANPHRLDLDWRHLRAWVERGLPTSIHPDAHAPQGLDDVAFGVAMARKGGLGVADVLNGRRREELAAHFAARRERAAALLAGAR